VITSRAFVARKNRAGFAARSMQVRAVMAGSTIRRANDNGAIESQRWPLPGTVSRFPPREMDPAADYSPQTWAERVSRDCPGPAAASGTFAVPIPRRAALMVEFFPRSPVAPAA